MGSRFAARIAGIMPLTRPVMDQDHGGDDDGCGGDPQVDVRGLGVLGEGTVKRDPAHHH